MAVKRGCFQLTLFGAFARTPAECVQGRGLLLSFGVLVPPLGEPARVPDEASLEFVVDSEAEPGDVLGALADLLIDLAGKKCGP